MAARCAGSAGRKHSSYRHPVAWRLSARPTPHGSVSAGLRDLGFIDGQNVIIELRYAQGGVQQLPELAAELVRLKIDVIQASGDLAPRIAQQATTTVPIVAMSDDILGAGLSVSRTPQLKRE